ncbi:helix-turn-helix transcriptional regulator [Leifsonia poae]|uniref:Transcriptional regulator n=1 Tax=Leifsonia poae TaxID=110933 RepID=A0A9W6HCR4_9MICO|nr:YafY family protein [Leifsonia poae]GLJ78094.1 transcriptional regulator [Leifsonia poae]
MATTGSRTLQLLSLLQTQRYWPGSVLAARLEVSVRTLRRDVDRLRELGYPVDATRGVDGGYQLAAGASLPPLVVDDEEAVALAVGLRTAAQSGIAGIEDASVRALTKVVQVMPPRLRRRVEALRSATVAGSLRPGPSVDAEVLTTIAQACRDEERLDFVYTARDGERTDRRVEPHRLVSVGRRWYLVAYDLTRFDWRSFRLDRLSGPRATGSRFRPRDLPADDAAAFVRASLGGVAPTPLNVVAIVRAPLADVQATIGPWATTEPVDDTRTRIRMTADNADWALYGLGAVDAPIESVSPRAVAERMHVWAERFAAANASEGTGEQAPGIHDA